MSLFGFIYFIVFAYNSCYCDKEKCINIYSNIVGIDSELTILLQRLINDLNNGLSNNIFSISLIVSDESLQAQVEYVIDRSRSLIQNENDDKTFQFTSRILWKLIITLRTIAYFQNMLTENQNEDRYFASLINSVLEFTPQLRYRVNQSLNTNRALKMLLEIIHESFNSMNILLDFRRFNDNRNSYIFIERSTQFYTIG